MPRYSLRRTTKRDYSTQRERALKTRVSGYKKWVDPHPTIQGTLPEKMVYAQLVARGIPFYYQTEVDFNISEIGFFKAYRPDFVLYQEKIIIEVQGAYWHQKPEVIESDAFKFAVYETLGYKVLPWWDYDIEGRLAELIATEPAIATKPYISSDRSSSETVTSRKRIIDDSKGVKTLNYERGRRQDYKKKAIGVRNARKSRQAKRTRRTLSV